MEDQSNWAFRSTDKQPDDDYESKPLDFFIGEHVQLAFPTKSGPKEYMFVLCEGEAEVDDHELQGSLANEPVRECDFEEGDTIAFNRNEVLTIYKGD